MRGMTAWASQLPQDSPKVAAYLAGDTLPLAQSDVPGAMVETIHKGGQVQTVRVQSPAAGPLRFLTYYYPGWSATVDGAPVPIRPEGPLGLITLDLPAGEHLVSIRFGETPLRRAANCISLASVAGIVLLGSSRRRHLNHRVLDAKH